MDVIALIGRILFVLIFFNSGYGHLTKTAAMTGYAEAKRLPAARPAVIVSGIWMVIGALLVLLGLWGDLGALMLFLFLVATAVIFHDFWRVDGEQRPNELIQFLKDIGLAGASLLILAYYQTDPGLTITGPLF